MKFPALGLLAFASVAFSLAVSTDVHRHPNLPRSTTMVQSWTVGNVTSTIFQVDPSALEKRSSCKNCIRTCGASDKKTWQWVPLRNSDPAFMGFTDAVTRFCESRMQDPLGSPLRLVQGHGFSTAVQYGIEGDFTTPRVKLTNGRVGSVVFTITNLGSALLIPSTVVCKQSFAQFDNAKASCYGSRNKDTKGGQWATGDPVVTWDAYAMEDSS